jgi:hypothetical protein
MPFLPMDTQLLRRCPAGAVGRATLDFFNRRLKITRPESMPANGDCIITQKMAAAQNQGDLAGKAEEISPEDERNTPYVEKTASACGRDRRRRGL